MITFTQKGDFRRTEKLFKGVSISSYLSIFEKYGRMGVEALSSATPIDSGLTSDSWDYYITRTKNGMVITWTNSHIEKGVPIAIILQYGHATRNGGYVQGRDYINPAIQPIFDSMTNDLWMEVTKL